MLGWILGAVWIGLLGVNSAIAAVDSAPPPPSVEVGVDQALTELDTQLIQLEQPRVDSDIREAKLDKIESELERLQTLTNGNPQLKYLTARARILANRPKEALMLLRDYVETREGRNEWRAHLLLGDLFISGFPHLARASYEKAASLGGDKPNIMLGLSLCAQRMGRRREAVEFAQRAVDVDPSAPMKANLALALAGNEQWAEAKRFALAALEEAKQDALVRENDRESLVFLDAQFKLLIDLNRAALARDPAQAQTYLELAALAEERGVNTRLLELDEDVRLFERGLSNVPAEGRAPLLKAYGFLLDKLGRDEKAREAFAELIQMDSNHPKVKDWLRQHPDPLSDR